MFNRKSVIMTIFAMVLLMLVTACGGSSAKKIDLGSMDNGTYKNDYFGITLKLPEKWQVQDTAVMNQVAQAGKDAIAGNDQKKKAQLDLAEQQVLHLFMVSKLPMSEPVNSSVISTAEKLNKLQGVKTGKDYLEASIKLLKDTKLPYEFGQITDTKLGGKEFSLLEAKLKTNAATLTQRYYAAIINGYAFNIVVTFTDEESKAEIEKVIASVKF